MRSNDIQNDLADGFEVAPVPPVGPDGSLELPPLRAIPPPHPRLCEAGPCRNYHQFRIQLDAADPKPQRVVKPDGSVTFTQPARSHHYEDHHYCYPTSGVETKLGSLPVLTCNRWSPMTSEERDAATARALMFAETDEGRAHVAAIVAYANARELELAEAIASQRQAEDDLANMPSSSVAEPEWQCADCGAIIHGAHGSCPGRAPNPTET